MHASNAAYSLQSGFGTSHINIKIFLVIFDVEFKISPYIVSYSVLGIDVKTCINLIFSPKVKMLQKWTKLTEKALFQLYFQSVLPSRPKFETKNADVNIISKNFTCTSQHQNHFDVSFILMLISYITIKFMYRTLVIFY